MGITSSINNTIEAYKDFNKGLNSINSPPAGYTVSQTSGINRSKQPTVAVHIPLPWEPGERE